MPGAVAATIPAKVARSSSKFKHQGASQKQRFFGYGVRSPTLPAAIGSVQSSRLSPVRARGAWSPRRAPLRWPRREFPR
jgi:hypothetical protein